MARSRAHLLPFPPRLLPLLPRPTFISARHGQLAAHDARPRRPIQLAAMPETESDHHRGVAAVARRLDLLAPPAAPASSSCATATATARDEDEEEDGFTFAAVAAVPRLQDAECASPDARIDGTVYPVFGRPRWSLPKQQQRPEDDDEEDPDGTGTAIVRRMPLGRLLQEDRWCDCAPSASGQQPAGDNDAEAELDGVSAETYCLWSPGASPPAGSRRASSPARCFEFLCTSFDRGAGEGHGRWMNRGSDARGGGKPTTTTTTSSFLPCKQDLVGLVAGAFTFRRSYLQF